jgi:predicted ATP-grasp superfamily ATP-dependent carboligase
MVDKGKEHEPSPAYVLGMESNGLGVARTLGRKGIPVVGVDHRRWAAGLSSKYVRPLLCRDMAKEPQDVLRSLLSDIEAKGGRGVLFPASDAAVLFISRHRSELASRFDFLLPSERVEEAMVNKQLQYEEALRLGIPMPETFFPQGEEDLRDVMSGVHFPAFIKPLYSHLWFKHFGNKGFIVKSPDELRSKMALVRRTGLEVMVQSIICPPGEGLYSVGSYFGREGYVSPPFVWHKLRQYPPNFGVGSLVESAHQPEVVELGMGFMKGLGYQGIGYVEFKKDHRDGRWKLIEMNARTGATNALQAGAGLPLVLIEYNDLTGTPQPALGDYRDGVLWWDSMNDLDSFWRLKRTGQITLRQWVRSWSESEVYAYYAPDDMMPALKRANYGLELATLFGSLMRMDKDGDSLTGEIAPRSTGGEDGAAKGLPRKTRMGRGAT